MHTNNKDLYYRDFDTLSEYVQYQLNVVGCNQKLLADSLNEEGVTLFYKEKDRVKSQLFFWFSFMLGNEHAHRNYINSRIVYRWPK